MYWLLSQWTLKMRSLLILVCLFVVAAHRVSGADAASPYTRIVASFIATHISPLEALMRLGDQEHLPLGIVYSDASLLSSEVNIDDKNKPVDLILVDILNGTPYRANETQYKAIRINDPGDAGKSAFVSFVLSSFRTYRSVDTTDISMMLWGQYQMMINPRRKGYGGFLRVQGQDKKLPEVNLTNVSIGDVLDWMIVHHGAMMWIAWPPPEKLIDAPQYRLWNVVYYSSSEKGGLITCCISIPADLKQVPGDVRDRLSR